MEENRTDANGVAESSLDTNGMAQNGLDANNAPENIVDVNIAAESSLDTNSMVENGVDAEGASENSVDANNAAESSLDTNGAAENNVDVDGSPENSVDAEDTTQETVKPKTFNRWEIEDIVLAHYLPRNMYRFCDLGTDKPYFQAGVVTNDGTTYLLYIKLDGYPSEMPRVYVQQMLHNRSGEPMDRPSLDYFTLRSWNGWTQICHTDRNCWARDASLWKVYIKCRHWLEMYRAHLRTGNKMSYYMNIQY